MPGTDPTADKPQSKLWFNDGTWWAVMFHTNIDPSKPTNSWLIYKLNWPDKWVPTDTIVDDRPASRADALWDGATNKLYIASLVRLTPNNQGRLYRFSYNAASKTYALDSGFPAIVMTGSAETMAFDKDSTGRLWVNYTQSSKVFVNHSTTSDAVWATPFAVPNSGVIGGDDISSLVAYKDKNGLSIGVLWSNHNSTSGPSSMNFSYHRDIDPPSTWQPIETVYGGTGTCLADDHINLKSLQADPSGAIFGALKTSTSDASSCTGGKDLIRLVVRYPDNTWKWATFGSASDQHTRPIVLLDTTSRKVYMFATAPTSCGVIYMKSTGMDNPSFTPGKGTPFISSSTYTCINNVTSTKQTLDAVSDLVVLASDESKRFYLHNVLDLGTPTPRLVFGTQPGTSQLSVPFATQPVVVAQNGQGKTDTTFNGPVIMSIKAGTGTAGAALLGTVTRNAVAGVASFTDLSINKAGAGYQLSASAAGYVGATSTVFEITKVAQTLALDPIPQKRYGDPTFSVNATALISGTAQPSGLPVSYVDPTPGDACTVTSTSVQITNVGACTVRVSQAGDATYAPVTLDTTFVVQKANQSISFPQIPIKHFGDAPFVVNATASSGLAVSLVAVGACKINGNVVTLTGPDTCTIRASQAGNSLYNAAPDVSQTVRSNYMLYAPLSLN